MWLVLLGRRDRHGRASSRDGASHGPPSACWCSGCSSVCSSSWSTTRATAPLCDVRAGARRAGGALRRLGHCAGCPRELAGSAVAVAPARRCPSAAAGLSGLRQRRSGWHSVGRSHESVGDCSGGGVDLDRPGCCAALRHRSRSGAGDHVAVGSACSASGGAIASRGGCRSAWNLTEYARWARAAAPSSTTKRRWRSAGSCAPGTLVQGKLANGMALENQIRPIFVGRGFGNYDDRFEPRRRALYTDVQFAADRIRKPEAVRIDSRDSRPVSESPRHRDLRSRRNARARSRRAHRQTSRVRASRSLQDPIVRQISEEQIKAHADRRFRSEYDYALFEYYRSAKVIAFLERAGVDDSRPCARCRVRRRRHAALARRARGLKSSASIPSTGFGRGRRRAGPRARARRGCIFCERTAWRCRLPTGSFDLVLSHAVIEHVADAPLYLRECRRVLKHGRAHFSVDGAVSVVCRRASAAPAGAGAAASPARALAIAFRTFRLPGASCAVDAARNRRTRTRSSATRSKGIVKA